ncbi:SRPBCC domain-containing protein [Mycobacteroides abscessus subsp. abscessus]|uniref:SRPBCC family protein n=1 Tax=Mycobacteroides abscessus TaxID=36809 RepID=UPI00266CAE08|nr:SRPBCC domain-containing protein [Mycobacteroides abscessus]MDO3340089.1 SRPBCC domain-containing protein [Mycobacteroides abscessus subsp. abscessus]
MSSTSDSFTVGRYFPHSRERTWRAAHSRELILADWAVELEMLKVEAGYSYVVQLLPIPGTGLSVNITCEYLGVVLNELVVFTITSPGASPWRLHGRWAFTDQGHGTYLCCTFSGFNFSTDLRRIRGLAKRAMVQVLWRIQLILDAETGTRLPAPRW